MTYDAWKTREPAEWSFFTCKDCGHLFHEDGESTEHPGFCEDCGEPGYRKDKAEEEADDA